MGAVIARPALFARLDEPVGRSVVWISAPAGSGKTTLAAGYVEARRLSCVWYQVDADDADPASFFHYLTHAASKLGGARSPEMPAFTPQHNDDVASFARNFFRRLFARATPPFALVIDNLNAVPPESAVYAALEAGFTQVPKQCVVIVTSRAEPPAALARLRAMATISCVSGGDLAIGPDEIVAIAAARGQTVSGEAAVRLYERTQGWAAALVLMLEHARMSGRLAELPGDATPRVIFDYLAGEIFDRFDSSTREFLLRVACVPRVTATVAQALSGEPKAARLLINLALNDYFVRESSSDHGRIYQFHPLLREFLRNRAALEMPEATGKEWLRQAAVLLQQESQTEDAVALFIEAGDWGDVARIAAQEADELLTHGRSDTLSGWLDLLPPDLLEADPRLLLASAASRAHASPRAAKQHYERAFESLRSRGDWAGMVRSACGVIDAVILEFDDLAPLDRWIETLDSLLTREDASRGTLDVAAVTALIRATLLRDAGDPRLDYWLEHAARSDAGVKSVPRFDGGFLVVRAYAALARGDLVVADTLIEDAQAHVSAMVPSARLALSLALALRYFVGGVYGGAREVVRGALASAGVEGIHAYDSWLRLVDVVAMICAGDRSLGTSALQVLESAPTRSYRAHRACMHYLRGWLKSRENDSVGSYREGRMALAVAIETGIPWFECLARIALVQQYDTGTDRHGADAQLRAADNISQRLKSPWLQFGTRLASAIVARAVGDCPTAIENLRTAFHLAREHGLGSPPAWRPDALADLCIVALEAQVETDFARTLIRAGKLTPKRPPLRVPAWPWRFRVSTFGGFTLLRNDAPIEVSGKGPGRPLELLKVLIASGSHNVRADQLADALWPHTEADYAHKSFTAALHRLRRMLDDDEALILSDGRLSLSTTLVWVDTWALEQYCDDIDAALRGTDGAGSEARRTEFADALLALYRGPFLPDESEQPSYIAYREQARARVLRILARLARSWEEAGAPRAAAECYQRCIDADSLCEPLYRQLMLCHQRNGEPLEALATYEHLRAALSMRMNIMPSPETQALYASLKAQESQVARG
jgi:ATP/maltotriose-dependent transcriptional regulator MalT/DNA-binding SARP family transcriptional activator